MLRFTLRQFAVLLATVLITAWLIHVLLSAAATAHPIPGSFISWLGHILLGDFGPSATPGRSVGALIAPRLAVTVPLALISMLIAGLIGTGLGSVAALRPDGLSDRVLVVLASIIAAAPSLWLGMVLVLAVAGGLHWLPPGGFVPWQQNISGALLSLLLPALAVALPAGCTIAVRVRDAVVAARRSSYVLAARAHGTSETEAFRRDGIPAAMLSVLGAALPQAAAIMLGTVIIENVFYLPGLGRLILDAVGARDLALVGGALFVLVVLVSGMAFLLQVGVALADPRRRDGATG